MTPTRRELLARIAADPLLARVHAAAARAAVADPAHDLEHLLRVARGTLALGGAGLDPVEAICAALLHDAVNLGKGEPARAAAGLRSAAVARSLLAELGLGRDRVERIAEAIEDHGYSRGVSPRSPLGAALQDADRLDALGALGIARTFTTGARLGARYYDPEDPWAIARVRDDRRFSIDHFFEKLLRLPGTMCTPAGRREAARRARRLRAFLRALGEEIGQPLPRAAPRAAAARASRARTGRRVRGAG